ncbi:MAG: hypothetical protein ACLP50_15845 [Solirubrobacteraceae bacterium]
MSWGTVDAGHHVRTRCRTGGGFTTPSIPRGQVGIVRGVEGIFTRTATVEFLHGGRARIPVRHLERTYLQGGEEGWERRKQRRHGFQLGLLILNLPLLIAFTKYFVNGGSIEGLAPAILNAGMGLIAMLLGHPVLLLIVIALLLLLKARRS